MSNSFTMRDNVSRSANHHSRALWLVLTLIASYLLCSPALAEIEEEGFSWFSDWEVTAYGTIGYTESTKYDDILYKRNITQTSEKIANDPWGRWLVDSRLGVQVHKEFENNWDFVGQILAQEKTENSTEDSIDSDSPLSMLYSLGQLIEEHIELGFLRYQPDDDWSFKFGRIALDTFMLSDHRNVGYSYHWVRPPTEFYGWIPYSHYDGFKFTKEYGDFDSQLRVEAFVGKAHTTVNIGYVNDETSNNYVKSSPLFGGGITWEKDDMTVRAYISRYRVTQNTNALDALFDYVSNPAIQAQWPGALEIAEDYALKNETLTYGAIGFSYKPGNIVFQGEVSDIKASNFGTYDGQRAYLTFGHRNGEFLPHITYSRSWDSRTFDYAPPPTTAPPLPPGTLEGLYAVLKDNLYSGTINQYTISLGLRWDMASQKALKVQCDFTTIKDDSLGIYPFTAEVRDWNSDRRTWCSTTFDWVF